MKIRVDIDTTPRELRAFFGLPDVESFQQELLDQIRRNMQAGMEGFDPATFMAPLLPAHLRNLEALQKRFWEAVMGAESREQEPGNREGRTSHRGREAGP